ncbi:12441_t:CDS:1, partial [Gigaspora rosea]
ASIYLVYKDSNYCSKIYQDPREHANCFLIFWIIWKMQCKYHVAGNVTLIAGSNPVSQSEKIVNGGKLSVAEIILLRIQVYDEVISSDINAWANTLEH